jgi:hypothetical protein
MDNDVAEFLLALLTNSPLEVRGSEIAKLADLHARALEQIESVRAT